MGEPTVKKEKPGRPTGFQRNFLKRLLAFIKAFTACNKIAAMINAEATVKTIAVSTRADLSLMRLQRSFIMRGPSFLIFCLLRIILV